VERQTVLTEFYPCITRIYVPAAKRHTERRGLAERVLRRRLDKHGWKVWRGDLHTMAKYSEYPSVLQACAKLCFHLDQSYRGL
jgi:hypothetical protein